MAAAPSLSAAGRRHAACAAGREVRGPVSRVLSARTLRRTGWTIIPLGPHLRAAASNLPGRSRPDLAHAPPLFGLAPGGVYHAACIAAVAVRSYRTLSPLPLPPEAARAVSFLWHFPWGRPRRALPGTVDPWSPDFPPRLPFGAWRGDRPAL
ncbi:hypothetical protein C725_1520 [Pacificimonas flava]|uniref:Uncharacterized protein n=1 Tax=Pacificimonas flava TaxID=1234595 RepID=M2U4H2_9SPHN|nr:hypothetical protein C725_1520 [Pacificimonas flava]